METSTVTQCARLAAAARTAAACAAVAFATLYGPSFTRAGHIRFALHIKFSSFAYLTAVLITAADASLGGALRGCWHAFCATAQVVPLAALWRLYVGPAAVMPLPAAAAAVAAAAFAVALPRWSHLTAKRIAFGQIVLVVSDAVLSDGASGGHTHPLYIGGSTAIGASAAVFAFLVPFPGLASHKVQELCRVYAENASQRMNVYLRALTATDKHTKIDLISQAKPLSHKGAKLLQSIKSLEDALWWERPWSKVNKPGERLQNMELEMRGIEYSLISSASTTPFQTAEQHQISEISQAITTRIEERIEQVRCYSPFKSKVESETREFSSTTTSPLLELKLPDPNQGWLSLYLSCMHMFLNDTSSATRNPQPKAGDVATRFKNWIHKVTSHERLVFATKCSLCLSLAMLLGLTFDKENGCWAGLTIAISFVTGRQAVFTIANSRVQGTALGSVYGVICCFFFHYEGERLLALLPWIIFTSFLRHSKMYGQTGGVSAAIAALVILGRTKYGDPNQFAIARLAEVFLGLTAFIAVEIFLQPTRAATLARNHASLALRTLHDCIKGTRMKKNQTDHDFLDLKERKQNLNRFVSELKEYVENAEIEPGFWYLPFRASCYKKLLRSLSNIVDMLCFITNNLELLSKLAETDSGSRFQERINDEVQQFEETLSSSNVYLEQGTITESRAVLEEEMEAGKLGCQEKTCAPITEHKETEWLAREEGEGEGDVKNVREMVIQCLSATRFCIASVMRELENIKFCMREIGSLED